MASKKKSAKSNSSTLYIVGAVVAAVIVAAVLVMVSRDGGGSDLDADTIAQVQETFEGIPASGLVVGEEDAPVTITEYADSACIHCATAARDTVPTLVQDLVRSGRAKLEYVPTNFIQTTSSERGALGVLAAARQDAAWPVAELVFHLQKSTDDWLTDERLEEIVTELGLDLEAWREVYQGDEIVDEFIASRNRAAATVQSTPTFIIVGPGGRETVEGAAEPATIIAAVNKVSPAS